MNKRFYDVPENRTPRRIAGLLALLGLTGLVAAGIGFFSEYFYPNPDGMSKQHGDLDTQKKDPQPSSRMAVPKHEALPAEIEARLFDIALEKLGLSAKEGKNPATDSCYLVGPHIMKELNEYVFVPAKNGEMHEIDLIYPVYRLVNGTEKRDLTPKELLRLHPEFRKIIPNTPRPDDYILQEFRKRGYGRVIYQHWTGDPVKLYYSRNWKNHKKFGIRVSCADGKHFTTDNYQGSKTVWKPWEKGNAAYRQQQSQGVPSSEQKEKPKPYRVEHRAIAFQGDPKLSTPEHPLVAVITRQPGTQIK